MEFIQVKLVNVKTMVTAVWYTPEIWVLQLAGFDILNSVCEGSIFHSFTFIWEHDEHRHKHKPNSLRSII